MPAKSLLLRPALFALLSAYAAPAIADTYLLTVQGAGISAQALVDGTADPFTPGAFDFTSGSGTINGIPMTLYTPSGTSTTYETASFASPPFAYQSTYQYDNTGYPTGNSGLVLDQYGFLFEEANDHFNVFSVGQNYGYSNDETLYGYNTGLTLVTLTATPEPASIALLGTGLLGAVGLVRRRARV